MTTMREQFTRTATDLLEEDPRTAVVLADIGAAWFTEVPDRSRVVNVGIREQLQIGVAAGLALEGFRPIVHGYAPFLVERPFEQIKLDLGHQDVPAVLVSIGASSDASTEGRTHQSPGDVALISTLPGFEIHVPGHPEEVDLLLRHAAAGGRHYLRLAADANRRPHLRRPGEMVTVRSAPPGAPVVIAVGPMLDRVLAATAGMEVAVVYTATVRPLDGAALRAHQAEDVVLVEPCLEGTSAAEVARALGRRAHRLLSIGVPLAELRRYGTRQDHDAAHGLDEAGLRRRIGDFLRPAYPHAALV